MKRDKNWFIPLIAVVIVVVIGYQGFGWSSWFKDFRDGRMINQTWQTFENYLEALRTRNLSEVKRYSDRLSETCLDESKTQECFALMDSAHSIISQFDRADFRNILWNEKIIILYTEYLDGIRTAIYFTRKPDGQKISGIKFCQEEAGSQVDECLLPDEFPLSGKRKSPFSLLE